MATQPILTQPALVRFLNIIIPKDRQNKGANLFYLGIILHNNSSSSSIAKEDEEAFFHGDLPFFSRNTMYTLDLLAKKPMSETSDAAPPHTWIIQTKFDLQRQMNQMLSNNNDTFYENQPTKKLTSPHYKHYQIISIRGIVVFDLGLDVKSNFEHVCEQFIYQWSMDGQRFDLSASLVHLEKIYFNLEVKQKCVFSTFWTAMKELLSEHEVVLKSEDNYYLNFLYGWDLPNLSGYPNPPSVRTLCKKFCNSLQTMSTEKLCYLGNVNTKPFWVCMDLAMRFAPFWFMRPSDSRFDYDLRENLTSFAHGRENPILFPFQDGTGGIIKWTPQWFFDTLVPCMIKMGRASPQQGSVWKYAQQTFDQFYRKLERAGSDFAYSLDPHIDEESVVAPEDDLKAYILLTDKNASLNVLGDICSYNTRLIHFIQHADNIMSNALVPIVYSEGKDANFSVYQPRDQFVAKELILQALHELFLRSILKIDILENPDPALSAEQLAALNAIDNCAVTIISGRPGSGKSWMIKQIIRKYSEERVDVLAHIGCVVSHLRHQNGIVTSNTITSAYYDKKRSKKDIVILDEAAMLDNKLFAMALMVNRNTQKRLIILADENQIEPIGLGFPYMELKRYYETWKEQNIAMPRFISYHQLTRNFRIQAQSQCTDLLDIQEMYKMGHLQEDTFSESDSVQIHIITNENMELRITNLLPITETCKKEYFKSAVVLGLRVATVERINLRINAHLLAGYFPEEECNAANVTFFTGQRIMINMSNVYELKKSANSRTEERNNPKHESERIYNGEMYYIKNITILGEVVPRNFVQVREGLRLHVQNDKRIRILILVEKDKRKEVEEMLRLEPRSIPTFILSKEQVVDAWAITVNKAQGTEFDHCIIALAPGDIRHFYKGHGLVALSRAKMRMDLVLPDIHTLHQLASQQKAKRRSDLGVLLESSPWARWHQIQ